MSVLEEGLTASDPVLRAEALRLAAEVGTADMIPLVRRALSDSEPMVRASALSGLIALNPQGIQASVNTLVATGDVDVRLRLYRLLLGIAPPDIHLEILRLALTDSVMEARRLGLRHLMSHPLDARTLSQETFWQATQTDDPAVLADAIQIMRQFGSVRVWDRLRRDLVADDRDARINALKVLARTESLSAWPHLRWRRSHSEGEEHRWATLALARIGDRTVLPEVMEILRTGEESFLPVGLEALAGIQSEQTRQILLDYRNHNHPEIHRVAVEGLLSLGISNEEMLQLLADRHPEIVEAAGRHLVALPEESLTGLICSSLRFAGDPMPLLRFLWIYRSAPHVQNVTSSCISQLEALLNAGSPEVRGLTARLYYSTVPIKPSDVDAAIRSDGDVLYALLNATLSRNPERFIDLYPRYLDHEFLAIRLIAAVGLLRANG